MFTRLIASRPTAERERQGLLLSTLLHGSLIAAAVLLTARGPMDAVASEPPVKPLTFMMPAPEPAPVTRATEVEAPVPTVVVPIPEEIRFRIVAPLDVPATLPEPSDLPWVAPGITPAASGSGGGSASVEGSVNGLGTPSGAYEATQVDIPVSLLPRSPLPRYPEALRSWRREGAARVLFVVDTLGRVEMGTVQLIEASHPAFAASVRATLPRMRFRAARVGARPVRQLVEFPITFRLDP